VARSAPVYDADRRPTAGFPAEPAAATPASTVGGDAATVLDVGNII
jgi:hypothetical protein